jgi:GntR family transcriptional repressor for pyruvate dehydrogenase complex
MRSLIADIVSGTYREGDRLPRETDLAVRFDVSRGVARECIRGLEERRLIQVRHGLGATVLPPGRWDVLNPDVLAGLLAGHEGPSILAEYLEARRILEIAAAALAAERATSEQLAVLADALSAMNASARRAGSSSAEDAYHKADIAFHRAVIAAAGNRALGRMTEPIHQALAMARVPLARPSARLHRSLPEHERIYRAIADGSAEDARAAMEAHLMTVEQYLREFAATASAQSTGAA